MSLKTTLFRRLSRLRGNDAAPLLKLNNFKSKMLYFRANLSILMRILFFAGSLCMMHPDTLTDLGGIAFLGALVGWQLYRTRGKAPTPLNHRHKEKRP